MHAFRPLEKRGRMTDVGIIGVGIHPFGRTEGRSGIDMGIYAVRGSLIGLQS
jgi:hypothetical protein